MKIGFTGTRHGLTDAQKHAFKKIILGFSLDMDDEEKMIEFHHGSCKGADAEASLLARWLDSNFRIIAHPGRSAKGEDNEWLDQKALDISDEARETLTHFQRNRNIVDETDILIGCPGVSEWQSYGGTFYTLSYAIKKGKPVKVIWPDGRIEDK